MGEVRVKVMLTNMADETLMKHGYLASTAVRSYEADALIDTGAVRSVIPSFVLDQLGLLIGGSQSVEYADGRQETVPLTEPARLKIMDRTAFEDLLVLGDEMLIGQTTLEKMDLFVDCHRQRLVPNPAHPDQPTNKVK